MFSWPDTLLGVLGLWLVLSLVLVVTAILAACAGAWWLVATPLRFAAAVARWAGR